MAYSLSNFNGADPTVVRLTEFQLKGYKTKEQDTFTSTEDYRPFPSKRSRVSNANSILNAYGFNDNSYEKVSDSEKDIFLVSKVLSFNHTKGKRFVQCSGAHTTQYQFVGSRRASFKLAFAHLPDGRLSRIVAS